MAPNTAVSDPVSKFAHIHNITVIIIACKDIEMNPSVFVLPHSTRAQKPQIRMPSAIVASAVLHINTRALNVIRCGKHIYKCNICTGCRLCGATNA